MSTKQNTDSKKSPKLVGQGTYGCVFYPGISCSGKLESVQYVTKVQKESKETEHEKAVGDHIRKKNIKNYYDYFAPVVSTCPLKLASIDKDEISKCDVIQNDKHRNHGNHGNHGNPANPDPSYVSVKIRYVGKQTLKEHLLHRLLDDTPTFFGHMIETQLYLLHGLEKLEQAKVIHYDLKSNNIMFHEKIQNPVIIDFGMSIKLEKIVAPSTYPSYASIFFDTYEKYPPWCLDVILISCVVKQEPDKWMKTKLSKENNQQMQSIVQTYFQENPVMGHIQDQKAKLALEKYWKKWIEEHTQKSKINVVKELLEYWNTWDTYSLMVMYYRFMKENVEVPEMASFVETYIQMQETYILLPPPKRVPPKQIHKQLKQFSKSIEKKAYLQWNKKMVQYQKQPKVIESERNSVQKDLEQNKQMENELYRRKQALKR